MSRSAAKALGLPAATGSWIERVARRRVLEQLQSMRDGQLVIHDPMGTSEVGATATAPLTVWVHELKFYVLLALQGSVGAGDAYGDGLWECDDLVGLVRLLVRNRDLLDGMESGLASFGALVLRGLHALRRNTRAGSRRNIAAHYDLDNRFFATFLSGDLMYSAALWLEEQDTLEVASMRKLEAVCQKLQLKPGQRVLEIGTGWGGFAIHAARCHDCHVTSATISRAQHELATQRAADAGVADRVTVLLQDYRDLQGQYDRVVSIEMIEAIGPQYLQTYFSTVAARLAPDGLALIQAITIEDHRYEQALRAVDFIKRYVFPGSFIPSINAMLAAKTRVSDLALVHFEDFGYSYARTLRAWRERFTARIPEVRSLGFEERFVRLWRFYLAYCEGGFLERAIGVAHLLLARPRARCSGARWVS